MGSYFAGLHLPDGDVVVDNSTHCVPEMITTSSQPKLFVIPNDRDFQRILADPITFHTHYILEADPKPPRSAPHESLIPRLSVEHGGRVHQEWCTSSRARAVPRVPALQGAPSLQPGCIVDGRPRRTRRASAERNTVTLIRGF